MLLNYYRRQAVAQYAQTCKTKQEDNKMKKLVALAMSLTMAFSLVACGNSDASANAGTDTTATSAAATTTEAAQQTAPAEKQDVTLRMWGAEEDQPMLQGMIDSFKEHYADYANFDIQLGTESESTAKDTVLADIEAAADVYSFASDQLIDLVNAGALQSVDDMDAALEAYAGKSVADVKSANAPGSVDAATKDGTLYAFPMSADNGYFLYYNSELVTPEDAQSWDTLLAAAEKAGKKVGMTFASGWYNASFFYGAGFTTALNDDGSTAMDWNGTSADGDVSNQIASGELCAVVSGTWDAAAAQTAFGEGYAATKLPTYTCGDKQIQQGSVAGFKLVGVNKYSANAGWATLLADWITNEDNQAIRFAEREIGPSNINVAGSEEVSSNTAIAALSEQSAYGVVQIVGGKYWDPSKTFGEKVAQGQLKADDEAGIQAALDELVEGVSVPAE